MYANSQLLLRLVDSPRLKWLFYKWHFLKKKKKLAIQQNVYPPKFIPSPRILSHPVNARGSEERAALSRVT